MKNRETNQCQEESERILFDRRWNEVKDHETHSESVQHWVEEDGTSQRIVDTL